MVELAIAILWLLIGVIILGGVIYIALGVLHRFFPAMDPNIDYAIWSIFGILILIYVLMALTGHAPSIGFYRER